MKTIVILDTRHSYWDDLAVSPSSQKVLCFESWKAAKSEAESEDTLLVIINAMLPDANGIEVAWLLRQKSEPPEVLIVSDSGDADEAEQAIRSGAWDYIVRPHNVKSLLPLIERITSYHTSKLEKAFPNSSVPVLEGIVGHSHKMQSCILLAVQAAGSDANVLISGETGTGKELLAWAIHKHSPRSSNSFVVVDCAALPETLVESTLLGHERGAFTGADKSRDGLIKQADGGTLFLDEVGELPLSVQKSFLRVLEERRFRRVGGNEEISSDFRLVSASNKDLDQLVREGKFREDLLFRLRSFMIVVPPLRERKDDIKSILSFHLPRFCERLGDDLKEISPEFEKSLAEYSWPGNVRELINALDRSVAAARNEKTIFPQHLPTHLRVFLARKKAGPSSKKNSAVADGELPTLHAYRDSVLDQLERNYLRELQKAANGDIARACTIAGLSRSRLYSLLKKYDMTMDVK